MSHLVSYLSGTILYAPWVTLEQANDFVFAARLLVRRWRASIPDERALHELELAIERLHDVETQFPEMRVEIDPIRTALRSLEI